MNRIAIIAAMDQEIAPLVRDWRKSNLTRAGGSLSAYEHENVVAVAGGIGSAAAEATAQAVVACYRPQVLISAGVAGALADGLAIAAVIAPQVVIDSATGVEYRVENGRDGALVTAGGVAGQAAKRAFREKFNAVAVDMEAAAVAKIARQERIAFRCLKAISDQAGFNMPPLNLFLTEHGQFQTLKFVRWVALRPQRWPDVFRLSQYTRRAAFALCHVLKNIAVNGPAVESGIWGEIAKS